ncbi:hypothetical protein [Flavobacterium sp. LAR06]|uniref:hypothetical protein n=1 Tax=Flavobacterium sp. LAR06 TaxID=3064897 RepID=UPI0035C1B0AE
MEKYRNFIEYSIIMHMSKITLCQQDDLNESLFQREYNDESPCHIYFIITRPRITIVPEKCEFKELIRLTFKIQIGSEFLEREIFLNHPPNENLSNAILKSEYPFSKFQILNNAEEILSVKSSVYYTMHLTEHPDFLNAELLYIGQSYGKRGERNAGDRLNQHSTLQKIYSEISQKNPDKEVWLNLLSFKRTMHTSFDGLSGTSIRQKNEIENVSSVMRKFSNNELNEKEIINFTEAALIKYFKPKYNVLYKDIFPSLDHKSYKEAIELDINSVAFEMNTDCINLKLFTETVKPNFSNMVSYTLKSVENRKNLFDMFDNTLIPQTFGNIQIQ